MGNIVEAICNKNFILLNFLLRFTTHAQHSLNSVLYIASRDGNLDIVKYLIENGLVPKNEIDDALISASFGKFIVISDEYLKFDIQRFEIVKYLISIGAQFSPCQKYVVLDSTGYRHFVITKYPFESYTIYRNIKLHKKNIFPNYIQALKYLVIQGYDEISFTHYKIMKYLELVIYLKKFYRKHKRKIYKKLLCVYYSPSYRGGKLAKKDLKNFCLKLKPI